MNKKNYKFNILIASLGNSTFEKLAPLHESMGYSIERTNDGIEALEHFFRNPPDLFVLDIDLQRMNGYQVSRILKNDSQMQFVPIILLTSSDLQSDRFHGLSIGADAYLEKNADANILSNTALELIKLSPWIRSPKPLPQQLADEEIHSKVNNLLDHQLLVANIVNNLQEINNDVETLPKTINRILDYFGTVFEFVVGGIIIKSGKFGKGALIINNSFVEEVSEVSNDFKSHMERFAGEQCKIEFDNNCDWDSKTFTGVNIREYGNSHKLASMSAWKLTSRGMDIGVIGMGSTLQIKFDNLGNEILDTFITHAAGVLDSTLLVNNLADTNIKLNKALDDLIKAQAQIVQSEKMASLGQLMAGLVHEMNNPLTFISGNLEHIQLYVEGLEKLINASLLEHGPNIPQRVRSLLTEIDYDFLSGDLNSALSDMEVGLKRASDIISDLRTFSTGDRSEMVKSDLVQIIESTINILRYQWQDKVKLQRQFEEVPQLSCNAGQIGQVVLNILVNAINAVKDAENAKIIIVLRFHNNNIVLEISDNGVGIPEESIGNLFQPFFTTKKIGEGMGLGLSIAHGIIARHNGNIMVKSEAGKGSNFTITLPLN